jgi:putative Mg2+ transporter-C (MgtC) family protein
MLFFSVVWYNISMLKHLAFDPSAVALFIKLGAAMLCGIVIGTERNISHKAAGMRTYALVAMGAALFVVINDLLIGKYIAAGVGLTDPLQIPSMIVSGIGFMGAGIIIFREKNITGLTTASGLWIAAGIGMACGAGFFAPAFMATLMALFIFEVLWHLEQRVKKLSAYDLPAEEPKL